MKCKLKRKVGCRELEMLTSQLDCEWRNIFLTLFYNLIYFCKVTSSYATDICHVTLKSLDVTNYKASVFILFSRILNIVNNGNDDNDRESEAVRTTRAEVLISLNILKLYLQIKQEFLFIPPLVRIISSQLLYYNLKCDRYV